MLSLLWQFFKTGPDIAQIADSEVVKRKFNSVRWRVFASITIGYAFYYIIRQSYSVIKKPLLRRASSRRRKSVLSVLSSSSRTA